MSIRNEQQQFFYPLGDSASLANMRESRTMSPTRHDEGFRGVFNPATFVRHNMPETEPLLASTSGYRQIDGFNPSNAHRASALPQHQPRIPSYRSRSLERLPRGGALPQRRNPQAKPSAPLFANKAQTGRQVNKTVYLPLDQSQEEHASDPEVFPDEYGVFHAPPGLDERHPILVFCKADSINLKKLVHLLRTRFPDSNVQTYAECVHSQYHRPGGGELIGDMFFFDYGVAIFWELRSGHCAEVLGTVVRACQVMPLDLEEVEVDEFELKYSAKNEQASISNDTITISRRLIKDPHVKMAISHALAQSTKLCVYEQRVGDLVEETKSMPEHLASSGKVGRTRKQIAQLIGKVFIQKSAVNLLSSVLDTPEYFWSAPDQQQVLYKSICEYLELEQRVQVLNNRFEVLTELLNIVREHENNVHSARLEWIVIWLIVVEVVLGLLECASILGLVQAHNHE